MPDPSAAPQFTPFASGLGGLMIGAASALLLAFNGRIAGISGILGGLMRAPLDREDRAWRLMFVAGLVTGGVLLGWWMPSAFETTPPVGWATLALGGFIVGLGTRLGSGCTSGHGVCGISRGSPRSLIATATFMATGFATVFVVRHVLG